MNESNILEVIKIGGAAVAAIAIFGFILYKVINSFLKSQKEISERFTIFVQIQQKDFTELIKNHLAHDGALHEQTIKAMGSLEKSNNALVVFLKNNGYKKKNK